LSEGGMLGKQGEESIQGSRGEKKEHSLLVEKLREEGKQWGSGAKYGGLLEPRRPPVTGGGTHLPSSPPKKNSVKKELPGTNVENTLTVGRRNFHGNT